MRAISRAVLCAAVFGFAPSAQAEVNDRRSACDRWEHIPGSETLGSPPTALLFCSREDESRYLALRIDCRADPLGMVIHYTPGFAFTPPPRPEPEPAPQAGTKEADEAEAARLIAAVPYEDSGIKVIKQAELEEGKEMIFLDFQSFGYTGIAGQHQAAWVFVEREPLSPIFSRLITGNYADFKLLSSGITERFPLRGSGKALRPVVEACRIAKNAQDKN